MLPLPLGAAERAAAFLRGEIEVPVARDAATVVLLRDGGPGLEAFLMRRVPTMAFAARMYVFPGGAVDPRDFDDAIPWAGRPRPTFAASLGCDAGTARALACAAVRETFEECGVLLAAPEGAGEAVDVTGPEWEAERLALVAGGASMRDLLLRHGLRLRSDLLKPWAHWVTPEFEPRRFDTRFFVAALPSGQHARSIAEECDDAAWIEVRAALDRYEAGDFAMLPPTMTTLQELSAYGMVADVLAASRQVVAWMPRPVVRDGQLALTVE